MKSFRSLANKVATPKPGKVPAVSPASPAVPTAPVAPVAKAKRSASAWRGRRNGIGGRISINRIGGDRYL
jgi:hypothetical protein